MWGLPFLEFGNRNDWLNPKPIVRSGLFQEEAAKRFDKEEEKDVFEELLEELLNEILKSIIEEDSKDLKKEKELQLKEKIKTQLVDEQEAKFMVAIDKVKGQPRLFTYQYLAPGIQEQEKD